MANHSFKVVAQNEFSVEEASITKNHQSIIQAALDRALPIRTQQAEAHAARKRSWYALPVVIGPATVLLIVLVWAICGTIFSRYRVGNANVSMISSKESLKQVISAQAQNYKINVSYPDKTMKSYSLQDVGLQTDVEATVNTMRRFRLTNFLIWWQPQSGKILYKVNQKTFNDFLTKSLTITIQPAEDAHLGIDNGNIVLSNSTAGKRYGLSNPREDIETAAGTLQTSPIRLRLLSLHPSITTEQLANSKTKLESVIGQHIEFTISGRTVSPSATDIGNWLELTPNDKNKSIDIAVNSGKVLDYINKLAVKYIRPPRDQVVVAHNDGTTATLVQGLNGVDIVTKPAIAANLADNLLSGKGMKIDLPIQSAPFKTVTAGEYDKWIEIDLTNKRMYAYEQSNLIRTFLVSAGAPATPTVTGQYNIYSKFTQEDMRGQNVDGSSYFQPHVPWVNYFYKDYAIHGNYWRPLSYFGNINSSHGCVGVVPDDGEWIYGWAPIGTTVVVHT